MAVTKIHPIKSTLKKALDYIENPDKTEDKMLVSSFGCSYETADIEFEMLLAQAIQKGNNLAHHLIQSFAPGEATPEQAHEIGKQLADEVLQGKYSYVLTTHIDKGHVHNHLIFCAVDMVNHRKYNSNRQSYAYIRRTSDRLCRENGLSVVQPSRDKGKSYAEWDAGRKGKSWKAKLKAAIDAVIPQAKDFDDFLRIMAAQGYEIKQGKFISFRAPGQERFTRCKTLGENYTEEAITSRIKGLAVDRGPKRKATKEITLPEYAEHEVGMIPQLAARFETAAQLPGAEYLAKLRYLILPIREADAVPQPLRCKTLLELPRAAFGTVEPDTMRRLAALEGSDFAGVVANNLAQFGYASPLPVFGGLGLNVTNPMSAAEYVCLGARGLLVQPETALTAMRAVAPRQKDGTPVPTAALCYGHLPLMLTRACPLRNVRTSCAGCTHKGKLRDRKGRDFPVRCSAPGSAGMRTVFNPVPLYMGDRLTEMPVDLAVAAFTLEPADRVEEVLTHLFHQQPFDGEFTRGLYYTNN